MTSTEIVQALGPGNHLEHLDKFTASYNTATKTFTSLLQYPFLQSIVLSGGPSDEKSPKEDDRDLRTIVVDGNSRFSQLCTSNVSVAQQVVTYGRTISAILGAVTIGGYAEATAPVVQEYVAQSATASQGNEQFFKDFKSYIDLLDREIALMTQNIGDLTVKIEKASSELANANVGQVIGDTIKALFKIASGDNGNVQIATLLNVGIDTLKSSFTKLWEDQARLKKLIAGLTALKDNLVAIKKLFTTLNESLVGVLSDSSSLLSVWTDIQSRLESVKTVDRKVTEAELSSINTAWAKAQKDAGAYIDSVSGMTRSFARRTESAKASSIPSNGVPKMPITKGELEMAYLLTQVDDSLPIPKSHQSYFATTGENVNDSDQDKIMEVAAPPKQTQDVLDDMALQTAGVMAQFNSLLQVPYLNQLQCSDPDTPSEKIDIQTMVTNYQKMYFDLQQETVPVAQDLQTYSTNQLTLLPLVVSGDNAQTGEVTVTQYLDANKSIIGDFKTKADALFQKSNAYRQKWDNAINAVKQAISECDTNITAWNKTIDDLTEEIKKLVLKAVLGGIGALLCFAAAAFLPGGILVSGALVTGGLALLDMTINAISAIGKLQTTINELKAQIASAQDTQEKLKTLLPYMEKIRDSLVSITGVWSDISQALNDISAWNLVITQPALLDALRPKIIERWTDIQKATQVYIDIITGRN